MRSKFTNSFQILTLFFYYNIGTPHHNFNLDKHKKSQPEENQIGFYKSLLSFYSSFTCGVISL